MRLKRDINIHQFLKKVNECRGEVFFHTVEGDHLNLKSKLTSYIFITLIDAPEVLYSSAVECQLEEDYRLLEAFTEQ
ncbi:MAG: hypothetical protein LUE87_06550 [Lachnospiraceae bacterium]|nr:hypothetical protein [Lachnospiraceae bacterium]